MAWTAPMTFVDGTALTATQLNTYLRDNMMETEVAKATTFGGIMVSTGVNQITERVGGSDFIDDTQTTTSTTYTDLSTVGPTVTCTTGTKALFFMTCSMAVNVANLSANMALEVSGASTKAASDVGSSQIDGLTADKAMRIGICGFFEDLVPGENVFTAKYKCLSGNTATFGDRALTVIPF